MLLLLLKAVLVAQPISGVLRVIGSFVYSSSLKG